MQARLGQARGPCLVASVTGQVSASLSEPQPGAAWEKLRARCVADPVCADWWSPGIWWTAWPLQSTAGPGAIGGPRIGKPQGRVSPVGSPTWLLSLWGRQLTLLCGRVVDRPALPLGSFCSGKGAPGRVGSRHTWSPRTGSDVFLETFSLAAQMLLYFNSGSQAVPSGPASSCVCTGVMGCVCVCVCSLLSCSAVSDSWRPRGL